MKIFGIEKLEAVWGEITSLLVLHWQEIAHFKDIPLAPDWDLYLKLEEMGILRIFTVRDRTPDREGIQALLVGYAIFIVKHNPHYKSSLQANQDILFIRPEHRGNGGKFILWCDEQLKAEGAQVVYHHVKEAHNFGPLLQRFGYELVDHIYARRLN